MLRKILNENHAAFSGLTHWLLSIFFFFLMWLVPWSFANNYIFAITTSWAFAIIIFFVIGGAALLADLDSSPLQGGGATAVYQLGFLGNALSLLCITISGVVYSIIHTRYDSKPQSQHRMLFHAPIIPILIWLYVVNFIPATGARLLDNLGFETAGIIFIVFLAGISIYLGANMFLYRALKLINKQRSTQFICLFILVLSCGYMLTMPYSQLRLVGEAVALGYMFHIIGDLMTKGSAPVFFPLPMPTKGFKHIRFWWKPYPLGHTLVITTGGVLNIVLNFVLMGLDLFLAWYIFLA